MNKEFRKKVQEANGHGGGAADVCDYVLPIINKLEPQDNGFNVPDLKMLNDLYDEVVKRPSGKYMIC